jgi:hypothetical protein
MNTTFVICAFQFPVSMRSDPTVTIFAGMNVDAGKVRSTVTGTTYGGSGTADNIGRTGVGFINGLVGLTTNAIYDATYKADAEL